MSTKTAVYFLTGLLIILSALTFFFLNDTGSHLLDKNKIARVTRIEISSSLDSFPLTLEKVSGTWKIVLDDAHRYPANNARISNFLAALVQKAAISRVRGDDGSRYGTKGEASYHFRISGDDGSLYLDIATGRMGALEQYGYFYDYRKNALYRAEADFFSFRDTHTAFWADHDPFEEKLRGKEIELIRYSKADAITDIARGTGESESVKNDLIDAFDRRLRTLRCVDITNIPANAIERLLIEMNDASFINLAVAFAGNDHCIVRDNDTGESWIITGSSYTDLIRGF